MANQGFENQVIGPNVTEPRLKPITSRTYRGFSTISNETKNFALYDLALIKQDIINHFHIRKGEKLEDPNFGTIIWDMLFEPLTEQAKRLITNDVTDIVNNDPRVRVGQSIVTQFEYGIQVEVTLTYVLYNIQETLQFGFDRRNGIV